jgi:SAC3 family protein LENG8/THP3
VGVAWVCRVSTVSMCVTRRDGTGRVALEYGDMNEFGRCLTCLLALWEEEGVKPNTRLPEFRAYRILHLLYSVRRLSCDCPLLFTSVYPSHFVLQRNQPDLSVALSQYATLHHPAIAHAKGVVTAVSMNDYSRFFRLYAETPNMGGYILDFLVRRFRVLGLNAMLAAYIPTVPVEWVQVRGVGHGWV